MKSKRKYFATTLGLILLTAPTTCYASDNSLTALFRTRAFSGSMETISKLNWVGWLLSGIISVFCLVGLFLTAFRIMTSIMYLSGRNVFDKIHEIKSSNQGEFFGLKSLVTNTIHGNGDTGSGIDTFIYFFLGLLPDVKMYSDFADGKEMKGVGPDTTVTEYMLKAAIPTIMMIFFLSIGFSGVLWQMYGTFVDAMSVAAEKVANTSLNKSVRRLLNADSYYKFGFGEDGTKFGALQENIANDIYNKVLSKADSDIDGDDSLRLGKSISYFFRDGKALGRDQIAEKCGIKSENLDDSEAKNITKTVLLNSVDTELNANDIMIPLSKITDTMAKNKTDTTSGSFISSGTDKLYIHVIVDRKKSAINGNYWDLKESNKKSTGNSSAPADALPTVGDGK